MPDQDYTLTATYTTTTPSAPFTSSTPIPAPSTAVSPAQAKSSYLASLRASVHSVQEHVNKELTLRMEEDNATAAGAAGRTSGKRKAADDAKEEQNYGEEVQEED